MHSAPLYIKYPSLQNSLYPKLRSSLYLTHKTVCVHIGQQKITKRWSNYQSLSCIFVCRIMSFTCTSFTNNSKNSLEKICSSTFTYSFIPHKFLLRRIFLCLMLFFLWKKKIHFLLRQSLHISNVHYSERIFHFDEWIQTRSRREKLQSKSVTAVHWVICCWKAD